MKWGGNTFFGSLEIANAFNQTFASVLKKKHEPFSLPLASADPTICLEDMYFTEKEVKLMVLGCHSGSE